MTGRASSISHILGKVAALGALLTGVRSLAEGPSESDGVNSPPPVAVVNPQPQQPGVSINRLPRPNELRVADLAS